MQNLQDIINRRFPKIPPKYRKLYLKVLNNEGDMQEAIQVMCLECQGWEGDKKTNYSVEDAIADCSAVACPLWDSRINEKGIEFCEDLESE